MKTEFIEVSPKTGLLIGLAMLLAGILFTAWKFDRISIELNSLQWEQASGIIQSSNFHSTHERGTSSNTSHIVYHGDLTYRYSVDGSEYIGTRYDAKGNMHTGLEGKAIESAELLRPHSEVTVYFDPNDPSQSLLKNGISEDTSVRLAFSAFLIGVGLVVLRYQWKRYKSTPK